MPPRLSKADAIRLGLTSEKPRRTSGRRKGSTPEGVVLRSCLALLNARRDVVAMAWRNNSGCLRDASGRPVTFGKVGSSDLLSIIKPLGRLGAFEVKAPGRKPTEAQRAFLEAVRDSGGVAVVISDVATLERVLDALALDWDASFTLDGEVVR